MIPLKEFLALPVETVARLVREAGPQVCVFPINGTRRWFALEYGDQKWEDPIAAYMDVSSQNHIALYRLLFDHGIDTLVTPTLGPDILLRGEEYMQRIGAAGLARLANDPLFLKFFEEYGVRVHFYGNYRSQLAGTPYAYLTDLFREAAECTAKNRRFRLFFGVFGNDATATVAELSVKHFQANGKVPDRRDIVERYYGEYVEPATLFIGFDKFSTFDYPLLGLGDEDLYFTVAPSPYLSDRQLRAILHDHIYVRHTEEADYQTLTSEEQRWMRTFYHLNCDHTLGVGELHAGIWIPHAHITEPEEN